MYRLAFAAFCLAATSAHAGDPHKSAHTHIGANTLPGASFYAPINYRGTTASGVTRTTGYTEEPTAAYRVRQGWVFSRKPSPLLETARGSADPTRSVVSVETFN